VGRELQSLERDASRSTTGLLPHALLVAQPAYYWGNPFVLFIKRYNNRTIIVGITISL
jgi:hypothetical protein